MKKGFKIAAVAAAFVAVLALAGCNNASNNSNPTSNNSNPSVVTRWGHTIAMTSYVLTFYSDGTYSYNGTTVGTTATIASGTYTGDTTKDGTITLQNNSMFDGASINGNRLTPTKSGFSLSTMVMTKQ